MMTNPLYLFSLDVLDTRLIPESQEKLNQNKKNATQSRWWTPEFFVYYVVFITVVPQMFLAAMSASNEKSVNYHLFEDRLEQGWIFGRKVDNSDAQYSGFRNKLPILAATVILHYTLRRIANALGIQRRVFDVGFAAIFLAVLHGFSTLKILAIYLVNFLISKLLKKRTGMVVTWTFNIIILFLNEWYEGYKFGSLVPGLAILDGYSGLLPRWDVNFNFSVLRMISYNHDWYESVDNPNDIEKKQLDDSISEADRISVGPPKADYTFFNYLAYLAYTPLYIAGPILTFNDFIYQSKHPLPSVSPKRTLLYGLRVLFCILVMEWLLHYMYVVALSGAGVWEGLSPLQISMVGFFNLKAIWLKLLIPWRFFRLWALLDEIDPPDNMVRCMSNNYSASAFWRSWHRSYNRWVTRYLYIPIGGAKHPIRNMLIVFTFVAVWHDIQLRLLAWGWLITLFVIPEVAAKLIFPAKKVSARNFRYEAVVLDVLTILSGGLSQYIDICARLVQWRLFT
ncbi:MBOAT, membrane-bound O-acyltransferase family-domain-containing protein [Lipomyces tetrasporus]